MTSDEEWMLAVQQLKNVAELLNGELNDVWIKCSNGKTRRRFTIEFDRDDDGGV